MNLIQAYKEAKVGDTISNPNIVHGAWYIKTDQDSKFSDWVAENMATSGLLSDNWQIERKPLVWEGEAIWDIDDDNFAFPIWFEEGTNTEVVKKFNGKRTKIRIEEIIDKS